MLILMQKTTTKNRGLKAHESGTCGQGNVSVISSGIRRIFQWEGVSVTSHRDDVSFSDVTAITIS